MKIIAIAAVTAGGKTTLVNELKKLIPNCRSLHFDDYDFEGAVEDFGKWVKDGADCNVWNITPLKEDIEKIRRGGECEYLILDYPFAYRHDALKDIIDCAIFLNTPLDIAMARRVLRDMQDASADEIRQDMEFYLKFARPAYTHMLNDILPSSDRVIDGAQDISAIVHEALSIIKSL